jgi:hypothetical protein
MVSRIIRCVYPTTNAKYRAFSGTIPLGITPLKDPNTIKPLCHIHLKYPNPVVATTCFYSLAAIGVAINGVPFIQPIRRS